MAYGLKRPKFKPVKVLRRDFRNFDKEAFLSDMETAPWGNIHTLNDNNEEISLDDKVTILENIYKENIGRHAPLREVTIKRPIRPSWMTDEITEIMDNRDKFKNMYNSYKDDFFLDRYKQLRNQVNHKIRKAKIEEFNETVNTKVNDSKSFHKALKRHNVVDDKKSGESKCCFSPDTLNEAFTSNNNAKVDLKKITKTIKKINRRQKRGGSFKFQDVTEMEVKETVKSLKSNSCGVDDISSFFVKTSINQSVSAITDIINCSFRHSTYPERWKQAIVIPIPKTDTPLKPSDYRPISLLTVLSKIIGKLVVKQVVKYLILHKLLDPYQSAYRKFHSTTTALLEITDKIYQAMDNSEITILTLLDYSKAFDCANHNIILAMLKSIGFDNCALKWTNSYLSKRVQCVRTHEGLSDWKTLDNGVPQGSILGPLIFTILLLDINEHIHHCKYHLYADDTQIYLSGKVGEVLTMMDQINEDLKKIFEFTSAYNLTLNIGKCKYIIIGSPNNLKKLHNINLPDLTLANTPLERKSELYDLGILITENLTWDRQLSNVIASSYGRLKNAYRAKNFLSRKSKAIVVEYYVLSQFNYGSTLMQNLSRSNIAKIQKVQNACTRFIFGLRKFDHISQQFKELKVLNMENRRTLQSAVLMHKIINKKAPTYLSSKIIFRHMLHGRNIRSGGKIHIASYKNTNGRDRYFRKICQEYNNILDLNGFDKNMPISSFKRKLKAHLLDNQ